MASSTALFDGNILWSLEFEDFEGIKFNPTITQNDPGENLRMRPLHRDDYNNGFYDVLKQLTSIGNPTVQDFHKRFDEMAACPETYYIMVVEDTNTKQVVAACSLVLEMKFIRGCTKRGRIEDVVVDDKYRGKQLGKLLVLTAKKLARSLDCYKLTLDCEKEKIPFYEKFGFQNCECFYMVQRF